MTLTHRGWLVAAVGASAMAGWVLFGEVELAALGMLASAGGIAAWLFVWMDRPHADLRRRLGPALVTEGEDTLVELHVATSRPVFELTLVDEVGGLGSAVFRVGSLDGAATGRYRVSCRRRGVYQVGPARLEVTDPFRLARRVRQVGTVDRLVVYPRVERLEGLPAAHGRDPAVQLAQTHRSRRGGEDFYTLREYVVGDDLRRVHWPSSAKRDQLMIRQLETPWRARALVFFDRRSSSYENSGCFEQAVRAVASVVVHLGRAGFDTEVWLGGHSPMDSRDFPATMEQLALVEPASRLDLERAAIRISRSGGGGVLVLVTGIPDAALVGVHRLLRSDYRSTILLAASETVASLDMALARAGAHTVVCPPDGSWAAGWRQMVERTWRGISAG